MNKKTERINREIDGMAPILEGERNSTLFQKGERLREEYGLTGNALTTQMHKINREKCKPPLPEDEVTRIAESADKANGSNTRVDCLSRGGRWEVINGTVSGGGSVFKILVGTLAAAMTPQTTQISVNPVGGGDAVTVKFPPYRKQNAPAQTYCRYYADGNGYTMLDTDCVPEDEEDK